MKRSNSVFRIFLNLPLVLLAALVLCSGCQTFSLSDEEFRAQQNGGMADPDTGRVVSGVGTAGYYGATLGAAIADLAHK